TGVRSNVAADGTEGWRHRAFPRQPLLGCWREVWLAEGAGASRSLWLATTPETTGGGFRRRGRQQDGTARATLRGRGRPRWPVAPPQTGASPPCPRVRSGRSVAMRPATSSDVCGNVRIDRHRLWLGEPSQLTKTRLPVPPAAGG